MKFSLISAASGLLRYHLDNILYRREIGMDSQGHIRPASPIVIIHGLMMACSAAVGITLYSRRWELLFGLSGCLVLGMSLGAYPIAYYRAFKSFHRERVHGTLEQIYLTSLRPQEIFDGKFYGTLAPFFEARRYIIGFCLCVLLSVYHLAFPAYLIPVGALLLVLVNHYGFSVYRGVLGGLKAGAQRTKFLQAMIEDGESNAYLNHLGVILSGKSLWRVMWGSVPLLFHLMSGWPPLEICMIVGGVALGLIAVTANVELANYELAERQRFVRGFKKMFNFDSNLEQREEGMA